MLSAAFALVICQEPVRSREREIEAPFHPALVEALDGLAEIQGRIFDAERALQGREDAAGDASVALGVSEGLGASKGFGASKALAVRTMEKLPSDVLVEVSRLARVDPGDFTIQTIYRMAMSDEGVTRFREARAAGGDEPLEPRHLLDPLVPENLESFDASAFPRSDALRRRVFDEMRGDPEQGDQVHTGPQNLGFLLYGALRTPDFWEAGAREDFLHELIERGAWASDPLVSRVVLDALESPLDEHVMIAPFPCLRGEVGFTSDHRDLVERLLVDDGPPGFDEGPPEVYDEATGLLVEVRIRILTELDPGAMAEDVPVRSLAGPLPQSRADWAYFLEVHGPTQFWKKFLEAAPMILAGEWPHALDEEVAERRRRVDQATDEAERGRLLAELRQVQRRRERDLEDLLEHCTLLRASSGPAREAWDDLLAFEASLRDQDRGDRAERWTRSAWLGLGLRDPALAAASLLEDLILGDERRLPDQARQIAITLLQRQGDELPGGTGLLTRVAIGGTFRERAAAMANLTLLRPAQRRAVLDQASLDLRRLRQDNPEGLPRSAQAEPKTLLLGCLGILCSDPTPEGRARLTRLLEDVLPLCTSTRFLEEHRVSITKILGEEGLQALAQRGIRVFES